jgi:NitT/TauT family transport system permease protein/taurine transport system permease protein
MIFDAQTFGNLSRLVLGMIVIGFLWLWMDSLILRPIEAATIRRWNLVRG